MRYTLPHTHIVISPVYTTDQSPHLSPNPYRIGKRIKTFRIFEQNV